MTHPSTITKRNVLGIDTISEARSIAYNYKQNQTQPLTLSTRSVPSSPRQQYTTLPPTTPSSPQLKTPSKPLGVNNNTLNNNSCQTCEKVMQKCIQLESVMQQALTQQKKSYDSLLSAVKDMLQETITLAFKQKDKEVEAVLEEHVNQIKESQDNFYENVNELLNNQSNNLHKQTSDVKEELNKLIEEQKLFISLQQEREKEREKETEKNQKIEKPKKTVAWADETAPKTNFKKSSSSSSYFKTDTSQVDELIKKLQQGSKKTTRSKKKTNSSSSSSSSSNKSKKKHQPEQDNEEEQETITEDNVVFCDYDETSNNSDDKDD